jgi:hypothetical protein
LMRIPDTHIRTVYRLRKIIRTQGMGPHTRVPGLIPTSIFSLAKLVATCWYLKKRFNKTHLLRGVYKLGEVKQRVD